MNRYWYKGINWKKTLALGVFPAAILLTGLAIYSANSPVSDGVVKNSHNQASEQNTRNDETYAIPTASNDINGVFSLTKQDDVIVETKTIEGEKPPADSHTPSVDPGYTGGGMFNPGDNAYYIYNGTTTISVGISLRDKFYIDGINSSEIKDFSREALRVLIRNNNGDIVNSGIFKGNDGDNGAYVITSNGFNNQNYLTLLVSDGTRVAELQGLIGDGTSLPDYLKTFSFSH